MIRHPISVTYQVVILLFLPLTLSASEIEFKGVRLGSSEEIVKQQFPSVSCNDGDGILSDRSCSLEDSTYAGYPADIRFYFYTDKLHAISIFNHASNRFDEIVSTIQQKYGKPSKLEKKKVQNRMGAVYTNIIYTWKIGRNSIEAILYSISLDESQFEYTTDFYHKEFERRRLKKEKDTTKDL